jgi:hypothetical protein
LLTPFFTPLGISIDAKHTILKELQTIPCQSLAGE